MTEDQLKQAEKAHGLIQNAKATHESCTRSIKSMGHNGVPDEVIRQLLETSDKYFTNELIAANAAFQAL